MAVPSMLMVRQGQHEGGDLLPGPQPLGALQGEGRVPTEDAEEKAIIMAGAIPLKKAMGDTPPRAFTVLEYTTTAWTI